VLPGEPLVVLVAMKFGVLTTQGDTKECPFVETGSSEPLFLEASFEHKRFEVQ